MLQPCWRPHAGAYLWKPSRTCYVYALFVPLTAAAVASLAVLRGRYGDVFEGPARVSHGVGPALHLVFAARQLGLGQAEVRRLTRRPEPPPGRLARGRGAIVRKYTVYVENLG